MIGLPRSWGRSHDELENKFVVAISCVKRWKREVSFRLFLEWDFWLAHETEGFKVSIKGKGFGQ